MPNDLQQPTLSRRIGLRSGRSCCYDAAAARSSTDTECTFNVSSEHLVPVGNLWFCPFHLPWSTEDLEARFDLRLANDAPTRRNLKDQWSQDQRNAYHHELENIIANADGNIDLAGVVAAGDFYLKEIVCRHFLNISDSYFPGHLVCHNTRFLSITCQSATFEGDCSFRSIFDFDADFSGTMFSGTATFESCHFAGRISFNHCSFLDKASFVGANFARVSTFHNVFFAAESNFYNALFIWPVSFEDSEFRGSLDFSCVDPSRAEIISARFVRCRFYQDAKFEQRKFLTQLDFGDSQFYSAPYFFGSTVPFSIAFPPIGNFFDWQDAYRYKTNAILVRSANYYAHYDRLSSRYRTLRYLMKQQDAYREEAMFWELEMRSRERSLPMHRPDNWLLLVLSASYRTAARYGNSISRPISIWFISSLLFAVIYYSLGSHSVIAWERTRAIRSYDLSLQQTVRPFAVWSNEGEDFIKQSIPDPTGIPQNSSIMKTFLLQLLATVQSVISLTLLVLFGFAVRRRFRML